MLPGVNATMREPLGVFRLKPIHAKGFSLLLNLESVSRRG